MRVEPVAETTGTSGLATSASPASRSPTTICSRPAGASPNRATARSKILPTASAESGVFSEGFQITGSPQTSAKAAFQAKGATGKLKAVMIPQTPRGCQVSRMAWPGRSEAMVRP